AFADPRHPELGWRAYDGTGGGDDGTDWAALRVAHCIPQAGVELTPDTFILEAGFERLNGVDFRKGCYVGQEVTARMHHKTELRKGLVTLGIEGTAPPGTEIMAGAKAAGTLLTQAGGRAIAYLRFDRAAPEMRAGDAVLRYDAAASG
ncbi:MAG: YgfZ/GcvT domain-containing protein, partial [Paracoccaceae bacterium]